MEYFLPINLAASALKKRVTATREEPHTAHLASSQKGGIKLFWNMNRNILSLPRHDLSIPPGGSADPCHRGYHQFIGRTWKSQTMPPSSPRRSWVCSDQSSEKRPCTSDADDLERKRPWKLYENDSCCCDQNKHENGLSLLHTVFFGACPLSIS